LVDVSWDTIISIVIGIRCIESVNTGTRAIGSVTGMCDSVMANATWGWENSGIIAVGAKDAGLEGRIGFKIVIVGRSSNGDAMHGSRVIVVVARVIFVDNG
jgi:hypothetical protein